MQDGFEGKAKTTSGGKTTKGKKVEEEVEKKGNILDYLNQAAERVVRANFKGDDTEPDWWVWLALCDALLRV